MKSTVYHYYSPSREKSRCCRRHFSVKNWTLVCGLYSLVSNFAISKIICFCKKNPSSFYSRCNFTQCHKAVDFYDHGSKKNCNNPNNHRCDNDTIVGVGSSIAFVKFYITRNSCNKEFSLGMLYLLTTSVCLAIIFYNRSLFPQNISILVVLLYSWQISVNMKKFTSFGEVYFGEILMNFMTARDSFFHDDDFNLHILLFMPYFFSLRTNMSMTMLVNIVANDRSANSLLRNHFYSVLHDGAKCTASNRHIHCKSQTYSFLKVL